MVGSTDRPNPLLGIWRIERTDLWGRDDLDLLGVAHVTFAAEGLGSLRVGAMEAEVDYRARETDRGWRAAFTWSGSDDGTPASGRGRVRLVDADRLRGTLFVHLGDTCRFRARRAATTDATGAETRPGAAPPREPSTAPHDPGVAPASGGAEAVPVRLADVLEALQYPEDWDVFLDRRTGRIVTVTENERPYLEEEEDGLDLADELVPDWLRSSVEEVRKVLQSGDLVRLPDTFDINEWSIMRGFADTCVEPERREILDAIHGRGAFRLFRSATQRLGLREAWFRYRDEAFERIARDWAADERVPLVE